MFEILMRRKYSRMGLFVAGENPEEVLPGIKEMKTMIG